MPVITLPQSEVTAAVTGVTVLVAIRCRCGAETLIGLVNAQPALCEACDTVWRCDAVSWAKDASDPRISLSSSPSRASLLTS